MRARERGGYPLSFTAASLRVQDAVRLARSWLRLGDRDAVRRDARDRNLLQARTRTAGDRIAGELLLRLGTLTADELCYLVGADSRNQGYLLWCAVCRTYPFVADFAAEVLHDHVVSLRPALSLDDYDDFLRRQAERHPELGGVSDRTRDKLRQVLFKCLREADLLGRDGRILPALADPALASLLEARPGRERPFLPRC